MVSLARTRDFAPAVVSAATAGTRLLFRIHRWAGLLGGIPLAIILISGTIAVFKDEIDEALNPALLVVRPQATTVSLDSIMATLRSSPAKVNRIELPDKPSRALSFFGPTPDGKSQEITVDPYTGSVLGRRLASGHLADILRQLHVRFYFFGATGRIVVGFLGLALALSGITGLILYPRFLCGQQWTNVRWKRGPQWIHSDLHKLAGITSLALNLLWAVTGAVLGLENLAPYYKPAQQVLHPAPSVRVSSSELRVSLDQTLDRTRAILPGFVPRRLVLPGPGPTPLVVYGNTAGLWTAPISSWLAIDPSDGRVLQLHDERQAHTVTRIYNLHDPLHFGYFAGLGSKVLWFLFGVLVSSLPVTGCVLWWYKRRHRIPAALPARLQRGEN
jgi:uncharacterized iron-regulated membrane protein